MKRQIVLVEDDKTLRESVAELLELNGFEVFTASDGEKGLKLIQNTMPDIVLCDIMMPKLDGYAVLECLLTKPETRGIPFIFLSAKAERIDVRKGMSLGADDYLSKPFQEWELLGAINSRLAKAEILKGPEDLVSSSEKISEEIKNINAFKNYIDDHGLEKKYKFGETIYREGDHANLIYLVKSGVIKTHKLDEKGKELITGIYKPDDFFGFTNFTSIQPYDEFATAIETSVLTTLPQEDYSKILGQNHELSIELLEYLSEHLTDIKRQLIQLAYGTVRQKTASTLLKFADRLQSNDKGNIHVLRSDLASVAGMATETLIRTLSAFKKEGLIAINDREIGILDSSKLKKIAD
ncbi:response regulator [Eudoraea chungangensis]|uniref:response regulator n=1 Tax=Eudoraea chungangensis TaxID=1481905 RepID=UPI0023EB1696|nr:response regulator [Eudoraea chungangensis]